LFALGDPDLSIGFAAVVPRLTPIPVPAGAPIDPEPLLPRLAPALEAPPADPPEEPPDEPPDDCANAVPTPSTSEVESIRSVTS
jgi:hypothetical protein